MTIAKYAGRRGPRMGTSVTDAVRRTPADLARVWMSLHHLTGGRAVLGIGAGEIERNQTFTSMLDRFEKRFGRRPVHCYTAQGYDMGNVVAHGLARAKPHSRDGLRRGLETIRRLDAAAGGPGNHISLGPWDHRGYKGDFIVMRQVRDGKNVLADDAPSQRQ